MAQKFIYINARNMKIRSFNVSTQEWEEREMTAEEIAEMEAIEEPQIDYDEEVNRLIRQKYTASQEFAILRQRDEKPTEYQEYFDYCEWCKSEIKRIYNL